MSALDNLTAAVKAETTVEASAVTLINGFASQIKATSDDPAIQALADQITASSATLAAAVQANTPASSPAVSAAPTS